MKENTETWEDRGRGREGETAIRWRIRIRSRIETGEGEEGIWGENEWETRQIWESKARGREEGVEMEDGRKRQFSVEVIILKENIQEEWKNTQGK